jgi:putative membrane protein
MGRKPGGACRDVSPETTEEAMRRFLTACALVALFGSPVMAQIGNPAGVEPGTPQSVPGVPAPDHPNTEDRLFARLAAAGGMAEVEFGRFAEQKARSGDVKQFARLMIEDDSKANAQLATYAKKANIPLPSELDADHTAMRAELERLEGADFDKAYMRGQVVDHQKTALLLQWELAFGQDADLQRFASQTLPIVLDHLQIAQGIIVRLVGQVAEGAAPTPGQDPRSGRSRESR